VSCKGRRRQRNGLYQTSISEFVGKYLGSTAVISTVRLAPSNTTRATQQNTSYQLSDVKTTDLIPYSLDDTNKQIENNYDERKTNEMHFQSKPYI
jgi:hypothetical protein